MLLGMLSKTRPSLGLAGGTYLVRQRTCLKLFQGQLEASVLIITQGDLDGDRGVWRWSRSSIRHYGRMLEVGLRG